MASETVVFITGAGRGIGRGLVERYLKRPGYTVIGSVRGASSSKYDDLRTLPTAEGSRLIVVNLDSASLEDPAAAVNAAVAAGVTKIDIVIANAGICPTPGPMVDTSLSDIKDSFTINALSPIALYHATRSLLEKSERPRWLSVSSAAASIGNLEVHQAHFVFPYGLSKAAMNFFTMAIHAAQTNTIAYAVHPGLVQTELGNLGAAMQGLAEAPITIEESCSKIMVSLDNATRGNTSGKFIDLIESQDIPW